MSSKPAVAKVTEVVVPFAKKAAPAVTVAVRLVEPMLPDAEEVRRMAARRTRTGRLRAKVEGTLSLVTDLSARPGLSDVEQVRCAALKERSERIAYRLQNAVTGGGKKSELVAIEQDLAALRHDIDAVLR